VVLSVFNLIGDLVVAALLIDTVDAGAIMLIKACGIGRVAGREIAAEALASN